ncbi:MAG: thioredoxin family protein [Candidatus Obscuribacterales bacterium]
MSKVLGRLLLASIVSMNCAGAAWSHAEVFSDYSYAEAKEKARKDSKLLLIDFTASWCPPCRKMESSTWVDSAVQDWVKKNAIAIQVDVDKDPKTAKSLHIEAMPTMVLFAPEDGAAGDAEATSAGGETGDGAGDEAGGSAGDQTSRKNGGKTGEVAEFGRQVGYMGSGELLRWLEGARSGKTQEEVEAANAQFDPSEVWNRITKTREKLASGQKAEALEDFVWLWENMEKAGPDLAQMKTSMIAYEVKTLCVTYPPAKVKFGEIRDAAEKAGNRRDWLIINDMIGDNARTLAWFDRVKADPKQKEVIEKNYDQLERILFNASRWNDAAKYLYVDPVARVNDCFKTAQDMKKPRDEHTEVSPDFDPFPSMVLLLYGTYVGAGLDSDAQRIADTCLKLDDTKAMRDGLSNMAQGMKNARAAKGGKSGGTAGKTASKSSKPGSKSSKSGK